MVVLNITLWHESAVVHALSWPMHQWAMAMMELPLAITVVTGMAGGGRRALDRMIRLSSPCSDTATSMCAYCKTPFLTYGAMMSLDAAHAAVGYVSSSRPLALKRRGKKKPKLA